ncbi:MAG: sugar transferase [Candidatus Muproteobacteria bacterium RBG_16_60_9]|uniref:Sugar transferase n=1 Tax=Candidatus Muproteobacteria bacterium RBG_16_60_9 TaxID=1817755 RepID=A0A1F6V0D5_9PROT|nr:MAG: sugar transferase [Candidatus Muproteobacteria bacterium RBG_16_60_9]
MQELLFLAHRIPFPPNKGDKIRSYHMLAHLARRYRVHVGAFIDDPEDWRHVADVQKLCGETCFIALNPLIAKSRSLVALLRREPLTVQYYRNRAFGSWVKRVLAERPIAGIFVFSSAMAQYVDDPRLAVPRVLDFVDMDSDKWRQYAERHRWPQNWVYRREARTLFDAERRWAGIFDKSLFVSQAEADLFCQQAPATRARVVAVENGVDTDYFSPQRKYPNPYAASADVLVFVGAMDYWANADAVQWFADEVFPRVYARQPRSRFYIVGARPSKQVLRLDDLPGVCVTGGVADVRPYVAHAKAVVAPLRIARGVQNKVLEAMAMARPVIATTLAMDGLRGWDALRPLVTDDPARMAEIASRFLQGEDGSTYGASGRACVLQRYSWDANLAGLTDVMHAAVTRTAAVA